MLHGRYTGFALLCSNLKSSSEADVVKAVAYGKRVRFYPLSQASNPPKTKFVEAIDVLFDSTILYEVRFLEALDRFVQREPWIDRDRVMIDLLKTIGIEKGKPFNPDEKTKQVLNGAILEAHAWLDHHYELLLATPYNEGSRWAMPASPVVLEGLMTDYADPNAYPVDGRGVTYSYAFFSNKHLGKGQFYLMNIADQDGKPLDGSSTYRLHVSKQWQKFREISGCNEETLLFLKAAADPLRHGQPVGVDADSREKLLTTTWDVVEAYLSTL